MTIASPNPMGVAGEGDHERALEVAYRYLNRRDRTQAEVRKHLQGRGFLESAINRVIISLSDHDHLDDVRFARLYAEDKRALEQWGSERIRRGLLARGIEPDLTDATLGDELLEDELHRALDLLRRRFSSLPTDPRERERALGVLARKGYESELALQALSRFVRGER
ncbi:MAG: regulatory protein RecX [Solirubrobacteraceae bacterium]